MYTNKMPRRMFSHSHLCLYGEQRSLHCGRHISLPDRLDVLTNLMSYHWTLSRDVSSRYPTDDAAIVKKYQDVI